MSSQGVKSIAKRRLWTKGKSPFKGQVHLFDIGTSNRSNGQNRVLQVNGHVTDTILDLKVVWQYFLVTLSKDNPS